jgi:DNA-binding NtrC family response regulator
MNHEEDLSRFSALVVDDDQGFRTSLGMLVGREGFEVREAENLAQARDRLVENAADVVLVDRSLPDGDGIELIGDERLSADSEFVVITGQASVDSAVQALRCRRPRLPHKPIDRSRLKSILARVTRTRRSSRGARLRGELRQLGRFGADGRRSPAMQQRVRPDRAVAPTEADVCSPGESGTGKELAARPIQR